jgi:hypothetical protein
MKLKLLDPKRRFVAVLVAILCAAILTAGLWRINSVKGQDPQQEFYQRIRDGVGGEIALAEPNASVETTRASVEDLSDFMYSRAGVGLSAEARDRLANMEASVLAGTTRRITPDELSTILAETAMERISAMTQQQIEYAAEMFRGFNHPDLPESFQRGRDHVSLRARGGQYGTPADFIAQLTKIKGADPTTLKIFKGAAKNFATQEVGTRIGMLGAAIPDKYGSVKTDMTPLQAMLIAYSVASDDLLTDSAANLRQKMEATQAGVTDITGFSYPSPDGHRAYGSNGYFFSSPLDIMLDDETIGLVLDRIQERSESQ